MRKIHVDIAHRLPWNTAHDQIIDDPLLVWETQAWLFGEMSDVLGRMANAIDVFD